MIILRNRKLVPIILIVAIAGILSGIFISFNDGNSEQTPYNDPPGFTPTPLANPSTSLKPTPSASMAPTVKVLPYEINLEVPFTSQAPHKNWSLPYKEFCEEASVFMAISYVKGMSIPDADYADARLNEIKDFEESHFGYYEDTTAAETAEIIEDYYGFTKVKLIYNPSVSDIKTALADKKLVIIPAAGRQLANPNFTPPGPIYHMLVIKGYTKDGKFITNDPGTRLGADYIYNADILMNAMHDWNGGDVENGQKVVIIVG